MIRVGVIGPTQGRAGAALALHVHAPEISLECSGGPGVDARMFDKPRA
jgi:hypothetical protein